VAAIAEPYLENGTSVFGTLIPESSLRQGRNSVAAVVLDEAVGDVTGALDRASGPPERAGTGEATSPRDVDPSC
jgi:hypothetical protein